jgi:hypothetical protein
MLRLDKVIKPWKEAASLNDHINLYGFWNETAFLTKSGDVGTHLSGPVPARNSDPDHLKSKSNSKSG